MKLRVLGFALFAIALLLVWMIAFDPQSPAPPRAMERAGQPTAARVDSDATSVGLEGGVHRAPGSEAAPATELGPGPEESRPQRTEPIAIPRPTRAGLYLGGTVVFPDGTPAPSCTVLALPSDSQPCSLCLVGTRESGRFEMGPLDPGEFNLIATSDDHVYAGSARAPAGDGAVLIELEPAGEISGSIVDTDGRRVEGTVLLTRKDQGWWTHWCSTGIYDEIAGREENEELSGRFQFPGLLPGECDVAAFTEDGRAGYRNGVDVVAGEGDTSVDITVRPGGRLRVTYFGGPAYAMCRVVSEGVIVGSFGLSRGESEELAVPAGKLVVESMAGSELGRLEVTVAVGAEENVLLP